MSLAEAPVPGLLSDQLPSVRSQCVPTSPGVGMWSLLSLCALGLEAFVGLRRTGAHRLGSHFCVPNPKILGGVPGARISAYPALRPNREDAPNPKTGSHSCVPAKLPKKPIWRGSHFCVPRKRGGSHSCVPLLEAARIPAYRSR